MFKIGSQYFSFSKKSVFLFGANDGIKRENSIPSLMSLIIFSTFEQWTMMGLENKPIGTPERIEGPTNQHDELELFFSNPLSWKVKVVWDDWLICYSGGNFESFSLQNFLCRTTKSGGENFLSIVQLKLAKPQTNCEKSR